MKTDDQQYSLQDFKSIVESSQDVIMRFDKEHRHLYVNKAVELQTGILQQDFIGKTHEELEFPEYLCTLWGDALDHVFRTKTSHRIEFTLPNKLIIDWALVPDFDDSMEVNSVITTARDITHTKKASEKLVENEERFKDGFKLARLATWEINVFDGLVLLNEDFCDIVGLDWKAKGDTMTRTEYFHEWVHDEDKERFLAVYHQALDSSDGLFESIIEHRVMRPSGETIWMYATIRVALNSEGQVYRVYGTCQDITELKRTEDELEAHRLHLEDLVQKRTYALKMSEDKLLDATQLANLSTWEFNLLNEELTVDGNLEKKLPPALFVKDNVIQFDTFVNIIDPRDFRKLYTAFENASKTIDKDYIDVISCRMFNKNGNMGHLNLTIKAQLDDNDRAERLYGTIQDVTHIISSKTQNERLTAIIEATSDIVAIFDTKRNLIYLNKAGKNFYNICELSKVANLKEIQNDINRVFLDNGISSEFQRKGQWMGENFLHRHDKVEIPVSQIMIAHRLENGDLDCYSTIIRDISLLKRTEEDLKYKNNELDTFVYRVSHDLRGPIASMMGLYNVVQHEINDDTSLAFFEMYNNQILRLNETILALIDLTRIKEVTTESSEISFEEIVDGIVHSFSHLPGFETTQFEKTYKIYSPYLGDKSLLTTIIQNLIENAIKYGRPEVQSVVKISIEMIDEKEGLIVKVEDNGRGIKREIQAEVFNMFFRGDDTNTMGSGLGLYILKNAVEKLDGKIQLKSERNLGSTFTISIPLQS